jgi:hypothetical protein
MCNDDETIIEKMIRARAKQAETDYGIPAEKAAALAKRLVSDGYLVLDRHPDGKRFRLIPFDAKRSLQ